MKNHESLTRNLFWGAVQVLVRVILRVLWSYSVFLISLFIDMSQYVWSQRYGVVMYLFWSRRSSDFDFSNTQSVMRVTFFISKRSFNRDIVGLCVFRSIVFPSHTSCCIGVLSVITRPVTIWSLPPFLSGEYPKMTWSLSSSSFHSICTMDVSGFSVLNIPTSIWSFAEISLSRFRYVLSSFSFIYDHG